MTQSIYSQTYYEILEVDVTAAQDEIHRAYQRAKQTYAGGSPALYSMFSAEETRELLKLIEEAYTVLSNQEARSRYDRQIAGTDGTETHLWTHTSSQPEPQRNVSFNDLMPQTQGRAAVAVPEGFAKTRFGVYEINPLIEEEIENCEEFTGEFLTKIRNYKKIGLEDLSEHIRVSKTYIRAVETEDYEALPAAVFVRGFVCQIAKVLGLRENKVANSYMERYKNRQ